MFQKTKLSTSLQSATSSTLSRSAAAVAGVLFSVSVAAQQSGSIEGTVYLDENIEAAGVTVTATSPVMPKSRTVKSGSDGEFRLPALIPGTYTLTLTTEDGITRTVKTRVLLDQRSNVQVMMVPDAAAGDMEEVAVVGEQVELVGGGASLSNALGAEVIDALPVGQNYRDMMRLLPGVQVTQDSVRGPNAGGSGQDNTYAFDGVNVTLPMFGTLSAEPSTHDIEQVSVERGGARAVGFNRSGGVAVDTKSKSGTNEFKSSLKYELQDPNLRSKNRDGVRSEDTETWLTASASGPLIEDTLFFYGSYFGPTKKEDDRENAYGRVKDYTSDRNEYFGKLTWAPTDNILINGSFRTSEREDRGQSVGEYETDSVSYGTDTGMEIATLDGSWIVNDRTTVTAQFSSYSQESIDKPDVFADFVPSLSTGLDIDNLAGMGYLNVPGTKDDAAYNAFVQPYIDQYGYINDAGERVGTGATGIYSSFWEQNFYRDSFEIALDHNLEWGSTSHEIHVGFRWEEGEEELVSRSNGWGGITIPGGLTSFEEDRIRSGSLTFMSGVEDLTYAPYYKAVVRQTTLDNETGFVDPINSFTESLNLEINDKIEWNDFTFNIGFLISDDTYYGEGLKENSANYSGFELAEGNKYEMYNIDWKDMIQPRLGVTWAYNGEDTVFANFAQYNPQASSLARAASWARNSHPTLDVYFDDQGEVVAYQPRKGSSGKIFQEGLTPRRVDELTIGTTKNFGERISTRAHVRYREGSHFWEDVWNWARSDEGCYGDFDGDGINEHCVPADIEALGPYVPDLGEYRDEIGGSSYVIAEMDGAYTEYLEFALEGEWYGDRTYLNASYVYSEYTGNIDQDNTSLSNDQSLFIGSSSYADDYGQYTWDLKDGTLRGDKPHQLKVFGYYTTDWNANVGAFFSYQSGQAWEAWDGSIYGRTGSNTMRYAEPAGSRRSASHWQMDLNYTQNFQVFGDYNLKFRADIFNLFDRQTGYNIEPQVDSESFGEPRDYWNPRRVQLSFGVDL